ncbi:hypothetical protein H4217_003954 [Coemansia sp. RSA 1939]|nr:hypothetical protein H4217_003954 [Coemansia sp. RSA 1939]KAJ2615580.1 hypothetical protein EV177_001511 [Coemansia sp. RSA 1804]
MAKDTAESDQISTLLAIGRRILGVLELEQISALYMEWFAEQAANEAAAAAAAEEDGNTPEVPAGVNRVVQALTALGLRTTTRVYRVPRTYYSWPLYERALSVGAPSAEHMCKTVVLANTRWRSNNSNNSAEAEQTEKYVCVVVQYTHTISTQALVDAVNGRTGGYPQPVSRKQFNFRLADERAACALTGFGHNGVAPIGWPVRGVPVVVSAAIAGLRPPVIWLGAGDVDYKMAVPVVALVAAAGCIVAHISSPIQA